MKDISLHILDIVQNSITANAYEIKIIVKEIPYRDVLIIEIDDNGKGMDEETLSRAADPFMTTRKTRKVGLGLSMLKVSAIACKGSFHISSQIGKGTKVEASYRLSHIDRPPLGDMVQTLLILILSNPDIDFEYQHSVSERNFYFNTREFKEKLGDIPISYPDVMDWLRDYLDEGIHSLNGGA